jgi:hypothetical protein
MIRLTLKPPSNNTSSIVFFWIYTWITTIWLFIATIDVPTSSIEKPTCLFVVALLTFWIFSSFNFYHKYFFNSRAILNNCLKFKVKLVYSICLLMSRKIFSIIINFSCEFTTS